MCFIANTSVLQVVLPGEYALIFSGAALLSLTATWGLGALLSTYPDMSFPEELHGFYLMPSHGTSSKLNNVFEFLE